MSSIPAVFNHIDPKIEKWLDLHYGDLSFNGRVTLALLDRKNDVMKTIKSCSLSELTDFVLSMHISKIRDYYLTANTVTGYERQRNHLFALHNIVIDVDCHDETYTPSALNELIERFIWRAKRDYWNDGDTIPCPNSIVRTGRGVQLWWAIIPCAEATLWYYDQIKTGLMDHLNNLLDEYSELEDLRVDRSPSFNVVGYFRLPFTYNTIVNKYVTFEILCSERYSTHNLAEYVKPLNCSDTTSEKNLLSQKTHTIVNGIPMQKEDLSLLKNYFFAGGKRLAQLIQLRNLRDNKVGTETRNNFCLAAYCEFRKAHDHEISMVYLRHFNRGFKNPMTEKELDATLYSAKKKGGYIYGNAKLIKLLAISPEEQNEIGLHPPDKKVRHLSRPNATRDAVRKARKEGRNSKIIELFQSGITKSEIARQLEIHRNTVASVIKSWILTEPEQSESDLLKKGSLDDCKISESVSTGETHQEKETPGGLEQESQQASNIVPIKTYVGTGFTISVLGSLSPANTENMYAMRSKGPPKPG